METDFQQFAYSCFDDVGQLLDMGTDVKVRHRYNGAYRIFVVVLNRLTVGSALVFSGPYAKLDYLARKYGCSNDLMRRVNAFRCRAAQGQVDDEMLEREWLFDLKALCLFISELCHAPVPQTLLNRLPKTFPPVEFQGTTTDCIRGVVTRLEGTTLFLRSIDMDEREVAICCSEDNHPFGDFAYVMPLLKEGMRVNVVRPQLKDGTYHPQLIVVMPDMLIDISSIAACFETYDDTHLAYLIKLLAPNANSQAILLGNFAGQLLDEAIHNDSTPLPYTKSAKTFFKQSAVKIATCPDMSAEFHKAAVAQQKNICDIVRNQLPEMQGYDKEKVLLEPSFFSEMLGLQGRMDLLQTDMKVLVEQKSGKKDWRGGHKENHYVQVLLYQALLHYNYGIANNEIGCCLLYSKYPDGLIKEGPAPKLLFNAMRIRNRIVAMMVDMSEGKCRELIEGLTPEKLKVKPMNSDFWETYIRKPLNDVLAPIHQADKLAKDYFFRMIAFVAREHLLAKVGTPGNEGSGMAALWNAPLAEKLSAGNILDELVIEDLADKGEGIAEVTLRMDDDPQYCLPNFRVADAVVLYAYHRDTTPDATHTMVFRGALGVMEPGKVIVTLRAPQKNKTVFHLDDENMRWALEHDCMEATTTKLYQSVASILSATLSRRRLLLAQRPPLCAKCDNADAQHAELIPSFRRAKDYFLLIGPPGTGKTSLGLVAMLKEELAEGGTVLLLSYTNRAVNEICSKLVENGIDFLRLGNPLMCPERYHEYLLGMRAEQCGNIDQVKNMMTTTRVLVSTTSTMLTNIDLFHLRGFSLAIIDEASQILEPHLMGILCARHQDGDAIKRFVLIGDHKQLPAVVQQTTMESRVEEERLVEIGLADCRLSLFERLLRVNAGRDDVVFRFTRQGRMHEDVADFSNTTFYNGLLQVVPLGHQLGELHFNHVDEADWAQRLLARNRLLFIASHQKARLGMEKVNMEEAKVIAQMVYATYRLYGEDNGKEFDPDNTVGVIVPYRHQIATIQQELKKYDIPQLLKISIDTVERFQGSQREVIIYGFTVQKPWQMDFLTANVFVEDGQVIDRKLNVALTRAKEQMVVVGNPELLQRVEVFARLVDYCKKQGVLYNPEEERRG